MIFSLKNSHIFKKEIEKWVLEGIISREQADELFERYELNQPPPWYKSTNYIISGVAFLLIAMSLFLLISANWDNLPLFLRMSMGLLPFIASSAATAYFTYKENTKASETAAFFSSLLLGANISLQAQIFHISAYYPDGILWWIIGTMPFLLYYRSSLISVVFQGLFVIWLSLQFEYSQFSLWAVPLWLCFGYVLWHKSNAFSAVIFEITSFILLINILRFTEKNFDFTLLKDGGFFFVAAAMIFFFSRLYAYLKRFSESFLAYHRRLSEIIFTYTFFAYTSETVIESVKNIAENDIWLPALFLILGILMMLRDKTEKNFTYASAGLMLVLLAQIYVKPDKDLVFYLNNLLMLAFFIWEIYAGISDKNKSVFMWGIFGLMILALGRYISLIENYFLASFVFLLAGVGLLLINRYWNKKFAEKNENV